MKTKLKYTLGGLVAAILLSFNLEAAAEKPNIVFIMTDDLGVRDLSCYGSDFYRTPNLDRLASEGMKFDRAYAACNVCSPTRAAVLTGRSPHRVHLTDALPWDRLPPNPKLVPPNHIKNYPLRCRPSPKRCARAATKLRCSENGISATNTLFLEKVDTKTTGLMKPLMPARRHGERTKESRS